MLPVNYGGHTAYQNTFVSEFPNLFPDWQTRHTFPILPASFLSSVNLLKADCIFEWCRLLKITPLYAILSGFSPHDSPGVGTFYDFFNRLWQSDKDNYINQVKHKKAKPEKGKHQPFKQ